MVAGGEGGGIPHPAAPGAPLDKGAEGLSEGELAAAKGYMRVDGAGDDAVVTACVLAAREYLARAGVSLPAAGVPRRALYDLVCHAMALSAYDQRDPVITGTIVADNPQLKRMVTQLRMTEPGE